MREAEKGELKSKEWIAADEDSSRELSPLLAGSRESGESQAITL
jgi:hypothetical protein